MKDLFLIVVLASLLLSGCGGNSAGESAEITSQPAYNTDYAANAPAPPRESGSAPGSGSKMEAQDIRLASLNIPEATQTAVSVDRKIIRNAELDLESETPEEVQTRVTAVAESNGGFVVESQQSSSDRRSSKRDTVTMTIRIPADKFSETLDEIRNAAGRVVVETVKGQDVTEEFIDIEARLTAFRSLEAQFAEIMKRANSVADALNVQRQMADVRGEIEKIEGRKRFLNDQASLSTIKLRIFTPAVISASGEGFFSRLTDSINLGLDAALGFILGLVTFVIAVLPFAVFIVLPGYLIVRYVWKRARRQRTAAEIAEEEIKGE